MAKRTLMSTGRNRIGVRIALSVWMVAVAALGFCVGLLWPGSPQLADFPPTPTVTKVDVSYQDIKDSQAATVTLSRGPNRQVTSNATGIVTGLSCTPGQPLRSGSDFFSVNGLPVLALSTSMPLWRDLAPGATGRDVTALQAALQDLGSSVRQTGSYDSATTKAVAAAMRDLGEAKPDGTLPLARVAWLPSTQAPVSRCPLSVGTNVTAGDPAAVLPEELLGARAQAPATQLAGARDLVVDGVTMPLQEDLTLAADQVQVLASTDSYRRALGSDEPDTLTAAIQLRTPVHVAVVPAAGLRTGDDGGSCAMDAQTGKTLPVTVIGSQLANSYVQLPADTALRAVAVNRNFTCP